MKRIDLLPTDRNCYKANLHSHTTISDGRLTPEENKKHYKEEGYSILAYTDHRCYRNHRDLNDADFLAIAAFEVDINDFFKSGESFDTVKTYHINLYDTDPEWEAAYKENNLMLPERRYNDTNYINQYIEEMKELGFLVCYNHPYWSLQSYEDYKDLKGLWGMEIYNYGCELDGLYGYHPQAYDEMLRNGNKLYCVATDDNHNAVPFEDPFSDSFGGYTFIYARELTYGSVMEALKNGDFYSSMGPEIKELYIEDGKLIIKTSEAVQIFVNGSGKSCHRSIAPKGRTINGAEFELKGTEEFIRITVKDKNGLFANSNAYFL